MTRRVAERSWRAATASCEPAWTTKIQYPRGSFGMATENSRLILTRRPEPGRLADCFDFQRSRLEEPGPGEVLLQTLWISVEPYMVLAASGALAARPREARTRMQSLMVRYAAGVEIGEAMPGPAVCRVIKSRHPGFGEGEIVTSYSGWQSLALDDGSLLRKIPAGPVPLPAFLGVLGIPGLTGYAGMKVIGAPRGDDMVVVSAAMGAVGAVAADVARQAGAPTVGITSTERKRLQMVEELGFTFGADRKAEDFSDQLKQACPRGVDVYFENVGGMVWWTVFPLLRAFARIPVSGTLTNYMPGAGEGERDRVPELMKQVVPRRLRIQGFAVFDYPELEDEFTEVIGDRIASGAFTYVEDRYEGLGSTPQALQDIVDGKTSGKVVIHLAD
ncbi:MAG: NADP-dependent oxidoreductase [Sphingomonadales bacterium]|nr:MAG: NADP-dependent oxidoreductase [Sphingomonadales bacterium]